MKYLSYVVAAVALLGLSGFELLQIGPRTSAKFSEHYCEHVWRQASPDNSGWLLPAQAGPWIVNFGAVNTNLDGAISKDEFVAACEKGLVNTAAAGQQANAHQATVAP